MKSSLKVLIALSIVLVSVPVFASNFRAADVVYLPAAGRLQGQAFFKTDIVITNVSNSAVTVDAALLEGAGDARAGLEPGAVERVGTLNAGESLFIEDAIDAIFGRNGFGQMILYSCRVGGDCTACDSDDTDCLPIVVEGRVYAESTDPDICGEAAACTFGQLFSGLPWYSYVSSAVADRSLDRVWITGIKQSAQYRSNLGFTNASEFSTTTLNVSLFRADGTQFGATQQVTLGPVGHTQRNVGQLFSGFTGDGYVIVQQPALGVVPTQPDDEDPFIASGAPGFFAYGSVLDNATDDPTTLEAVYPVEFDYTEVYGKVNQTGRAVRHPAGD
ncbi:MAG TPA: hypothetical protein VMO47_16185 [Rhodothermales bacterium]|nr:hypothetical protein [Rhodothermales bacterium]